MSAEHLAVINEVMQQAGYTKTEEPNARDETGGMWENGSIDTAAELFEARGWGVGPAELDTGDPPARLSIHAPDQNGIFVLLWGLLKTDNHGMLIEIYGDYIDDDTFEDEFGNPPRSQGVAYMYED